MKKIILLFAILLITSFAYSYYADFVIYNAGILYVDGIEAETSGGTISFNSEIYMGNNYWGDGYPIPVTDYVVIDDIKADGTRFGMTIANVDGYDMITATRDHDGIGGSDTPLLTIVGDLALSGDLTVGGTESYSASMYFAGNAVAQVMETASIPLCVKNFTQGTSLDGFTFDAGSTAGITVYADYAGTVAGTVLATSTHGLTTGDIISIRGTTNYNGIFQVTVVDGTHFYFTDTWVADDGASDFEEPSHLIASQGTNIKYDVLYALSASEAGGAGSTFLWQVYVNTTASAETIISRKFANNDVGSVTGCGEIIVSSGDWVFLTIQSGGTNNVTMNYGCLKVSQD